MSTTFVPVRTFTLQFEAERGQQLLEESGIASVMQADNASGWAPHISVAGGGITLLVDPANLERAREILKEDAA